jgi:hypothetical protein
VKDELDPAGNLKFLENAMTLIMVPRWALERYRLIASVDKKSTAQRPV